jgi:hypothetical protein
VGLRRSPAGRSSPAPGQAAQAGLQRVRGGDGRHKAGGGTPPLHPSPPW